MLVPVLRRGRALFLIHQRRPLTNQLLVSLTVPLTHLDGNRHLGIIGRDSDFDLGLPVEDVTY